MEPANSSNSCKKNLYGNWNILKDHVYTQDNAVVIPFISTVMVLVAQYVQLSVTVWKCIVMILLRPQSVQTVKESSRTHRTTELTSEVKTENSVCKLVLGEVTALGVIQDTATVNWQQIANVHRDLLELTVK